MSDGSPAIDAEAFDRLFEITGGDLEFVDELVDTYLADADLQVEALRAAVTAGDDGAAMRPAHTLKSSSMNVGALGLADQCRSLEADARAGAVPDLAARVEACAATLEVVRGELLAKRVGR